MDEHNYMDDQAGQVPEGYEPGSDADIHVTSIVFTGIIGAVLLIVIVMLLKALYYHTLEVERMQKQGKGIDVTLADLRNKQAEQIGQYRWVNAHTGMVGIPIDDAMKLVTQEQASHASEGIEITDWDHNPSDQHAVPGDLLMSNSNALETSFGQGMAAVIRAMSQGMGTQKDENVENASGIGTAGQGAEAAGGNK